MRRFIEAKSKLMTANIAIYAAKFARYYLANRAPLHILDRIALAAVSRAPSCPETVPFNRSTPKPRIGSNRRHLSPPLPRRAAGRGPLAADDAASWSNRMATAPPTASVPARKRSPVVKVPMASFITPTMKGPTSPPAFPIELMSARPAAAAVAREERGGEGPECPDGGIDADGDGERKHHGRERQAQGRGRKGGRGDEQRQRHVPGPLARQFGVPSPQRHVAAGEEVGDGGEQADLKRRTARSFGSPAASRSRCRRVRPRCRNRGSRAQGREVG